MSITKERPIPRLGPWALRKEPVFGVVGGRDLGERLARVATVVSISPRADVADVPSVVDAVLVQLSAFLPGIGAWAYGLQPEGYDRADVLAKLVREARANACPVLVIDDVPVEARNSWQYILLAAADDVAKLGPAVADGVKWNPGVHWDSVAWMRQGSQTGAPVVLAEQDGDWKQTQRRAVAAGTAIVDAHDPWESHLALELAGLGVMIRGRAADESVPVQGELDPRAALGILCGRLGLDVVAGTNSIIVLDEDAGDVEQQEANVAVGPNGVVTTREGLPGVLVSAGANDVVLITPRGVAPGEPELVAAKSALERMAEPQVVAIGDVVAARATVARASAVLDDDLFTLLWDQATRRVGTA